jgi:hypothetical protein
LSSLLFRARRRPDRAGGSRPCFCCPPAGRCVPLPLIDLTLNELMGLRAWRSFTPTPPAHGFAAVSEPRARGRRGGYAGAQGLQVLPEGMAEPALGQRAPAGLGHEIRLQHPVLPALPALKDGQHLGLEAGGRAARSLLASTISAHSSRAGCARRRSAGSRSRAPDGRVSGRALSGRRGAQPRGRCAGHAGRYGWSDSRSLPWAARLRRSVPP